MNTEPRFISIDDFRAYWGKDLKEYIRTDDDPSREATLFLYRIEERVTDYIDAVTFRKVPWDCLSNYQLEKFQKALLEQAMYICRQGDLGMDSGYDQERGKIVDRDYIYSIAICDPCLDKLKAAGLFNLKIVNRRRFMRYDSLGVGYNSLVGREATTKRENVPVTPITPTDPGAINPTETTNISCGYGYTEDD